MGVQDHPASVMVADFHPTDAVEVEQVRACACMHTCKDDNGCAVLKSNLKNSLKDTISGFLMLVCAREVDVDDVEEQKRWTSNARQKLSNLVHTAHQAPAVSQTKTKACNS
jgi:hypothetical protein